MDPDPMWYKIQKERQTQTIRMFRRNHIWGWINYLESLMEKENLLGERIRKSFLVTEIDFENEQPMDRKGNQWEEWILEQQQKKK